MNMPFYTRVNFLSAEIRRSWITKVNSLV